MKSPMTLWRVLSQELGEGCCVCTNRDLETVTMRFEHEGWSFLTITLPRFGKDFDEALADGAVAHDHFAGFRRRGGLPRFLGGFLELVFDRRSGVLLSVPNVQAVKAIRQLTRLFAKVALDCSRERERAAYAQYIETDVELAAAEQSWSSDDVRRFARISRLLFGRVLSHVDNLHGTGQLRPKHGPGATADRLRGNAKYDQTEWPWRLEHGGFHAVDYLLPNPRYWINLERVEFLSPGAERPVRVISVPKTLETPRIIAIEPTCMQYAQQAVAEALVETLEADSVSKHFVGFTDQVPNQHLAKEGSKDGSLATLDLSEASDRVSNQLVEILLQGFSHFRDAVQSSRSRRADVPGHGLHDLTKFASMGSALTFPIEAMVFTTIVFSGIERAVGRRLTIRDVMSLVGKVRVYGDDIVVPAEYAIAVMEDLHLYGFKVNLHKSFWAGKFRESCGKEYYDGHDVSIVKLRQVPPSTLQDVEELVSWVDFRNQLYAAGYRSAVEPIDSFLETLLQGRFPKIGPDSPLLGRVTDDGDYTIDLMCPRTHKPLARGWVVSAPVPKNKIDGEGALLKFFLKRGGLPSADRDHLERSGRPRAVSIKRVKGPVL